jgi:hypothetical protein
MATNLGAAHVIEGDDIELLPLLLHRIIELRPGLRLGALPEILHMGASGVGMPVTVNKILLHLHTPCDISGKLSLPGVQLGIVQCIEQVMQLFK